MWKSTLSSLECSVNTFLSWTNNKKNWLMIDLKTFFGRVVGAALFLFMIISEYRIVLNESGRMADFVSSVKILHRACCDWICRW